MAKTRRMSPAKGPSAPGRLRIVAGKWRRRLLPVAAVDGLRPTPERVRETLFNWLAPRIDGARCLDLCAGTGALGFEALSRGAAEVTMIENSPPALRALHDSAKLLNATAATIIEADALRWLAQAETDRYDVVFIDPPYAAGIVPELCRLLSDRAWLADDALVYLEHDRQQAPPAYPGQWATLKDKTAGNVRYMLLAARAAT